MNKAELVVEVQKNIGGDVSKAAAERALDAVLAGVAKGIKKDKEVSLVGFGTFRVGRRAARRGFDPRARKIMTIKAMKVVKFKAGKDLKALV